MRQVPDLPLTVSHTVSRRPAGDVLSDTRQASLIDFGRIKCIHTYMANKFEEFDEVIANCAAVRTLSAARSVTKIYGDTLRPLGITITQFTLLITIGRVKPESISEIGKWLNIDRTSLTRNLKPLETAGLVTRSNEGPQRKREIKLTKEGEDLLRSALPLWQHAQDQIKAKFNMKDFKAAMWSLEVLADFPVSHS